MAEKIKEGSKVRLRTGEGPTMAVEEVTTDEFSNRTYATCVWLDKSGKMQREALQTTALELVTDAPRGPTPQPDSSWLS